METPADRPGSPALRETAFPTTQWSLVLQAGAEETVLARASLESLCRRYWYPLYAFLRRQGHPHHTAEDLTQGFFAHLLASDALARAVPERGRFRTFLLTSLRHYSTSVWRRSHAHKRGGTIPALPLELPNAEGRFATEPTDPGLTPEEAFDRHWACGLIQQAIDELHDEYARSGRGNLFADLLLHACGEPAGELQSTAARRLGLNEEAFSVAVSRLRRRLRDRLRAHVFSTVSQPGETDDELRILLAALRHRPAPV